MPAAPPGMPYRVIGSTATGDTRSIVVFWRGRTVMLDGPAELDDDYVVEAVLDDALLVRHRPSGTGSLVPLVLRRAPEGPARDPEMLPRD